jgi:hypothetical protein
MGRVDPGTARVTAVTPLEELDTAVTTLAVGAGGVWVGGALHLSPVPRVVVDRIDSPSGRLGGVFTLARATEGLLVADQDSLWFAAFGGPPAAAARPLPDVTNPTKEARLPPS